jgi:acetyl-CoA carboxylase carboxyltransferase component
MNSKHVRADLNLAWPSAEIAVMGAEGAAKIVFRREIQAAKDPKAEEQRLVADYKAKFANPYQAAAHGFVDDVIEPRRTRPMLIQALEFLRSKRDGNPPKKHGNIPL